MTRRATPADGGLRERKKAKTKIAIRQNALRLFSVQGYAETTMEQIADATEVSVRTVFRYFPTKDDLVESDEYISSLVAAFEEQPDDLSLIAAFRAAFAASLGSLGFDQLASQRERQLLALSVPELWMASLANITQVRSRIAELVAARCDRGTEDAAVRSFAGAIFGILLSVWFEWAQNPQLDAAAAIDESLVHLERRTLD